MSERLKDTLHRWLPKLTILSLLVLFASFVFLEFYVVPRRTAAVEDRDEWRDRFREDEQARAGEAKAALERIVGLIDTLDGNQKTQQALSEAVAQEEAIGEVWVTNAQGLIVYYGRHNPPIRNVADFPLRTLTELLETVPEGLLQPIQQTAILLPAVIGGYRGGYIDISSQDRDLIPKHLIISTEPYLHRAPRRPVEMTRVKDGLIAVAASMAASETLHKSEDNPIERLKRIRLVHNITVAVVMLGSLILFWLSIPAWMVIDAQKRRERASVWGLFGLLGNMIALVVYLLVRENGNPSENS
ncbi:MAG: hypothetical protein F4Z30_14885 [Gemmatimonadetes bacterium]|nr:hypothetical protein [Gemmatimonadota bacterium]